jgi:DNA-directed RNA polymerase sigma subunit (sigma70/sigma32)
MGNDDRAEAAEAEETPIFNLTDKDRQILAMRDEDYKPQTLEQLKQLICISDI